jgi:hypothetical protein
MNYENKVKKGYIKIIDPSKVKKRYEALPHNAQPIPNYPTYYATPEGEIWRDSPGQGIRKPRIIKLKDRYNSSNGYHHIQPYVNNKKTNTYTHRLVLAAFKGWPPKGYECNHIDRNTSNNALYNLEWIPKEKNLSLIQRFTGKRGPNKNKTNSKWSKLKPEVIKLKKEGKKPREISSILNIPCKVIYVFKDF